MKGTRYGAFTSIGKLIRLAKQQHFSTIKTTFIGETKWSHVTKFILLQVLERSMSVLNLISDTEYKNGTKKVVSAYHRKKLYLSKRGYTFLWLRKIEDK